MKIIKLYVAAMLLLLQYSINAQSAPENDCDANSYNPFTEDIFNEQDSCFPNTGPFFTLEEFRAAQTHDTALGIPIEDIQITPSDDSLCIQYPELCPTDATNMQTAMSSAFGGMTLENVYDCLEIGCSPMLDTFAFNINNIANALIDADLSDITMDGLIDEINEDAAMDPDEEPLTQEEEDILTDWADGQTIDQIAEDIGQGLLTVDVKAKIAEAFGATANEDCDDWLGLSFADLGLAGDGEAKAAIKEEIKKQLLNSLSVLSPESGSSPLEGDADPDWFGGEIAGMGMSAPAPGVGEVVSAGQTSTNLYNGKGVFSYPLDQIATKDIAESFGISTSLGGLKINDQEGVLGSNMNLSGGGKISKVVKGLPDDIQGVVKSYSYGEKRGFKIVVELSNFELGVEFATGSPLLKKLVKKILCKALEAVLNELLGIHVGATCETTGEGNNVLDVILGSANQDINNFSDEIKDLFDPEDGKLKNDNKAMKFFNKEHGCSFQQGNGFDWEVPSAANASPISLDIYWTAAHFNYIPNVRVTIKVPAGGVVFKFSTTVRLGFKVLKMPAPVTIEKKVLGFNYIKEQEHMGEFSLNPITDANGFDEITGTSTKLGYLKKTQSTYKRSDREFFKPEAEKFMNVVEDITSIFNSDADGSVIYHDEKIDLEPDEYHYDFGGYSGKFFVQPNGKVLLIPYQDFIVDIKWGTGKRDKGVIYEFTFTTPEGVKYTFDLSTTARYDYYSMPTSLRYPEHKNSSAFNRTEFEKPEMATEKMLFLRTLMGWPRYFEKKKDFGTNYFVERGRAYTANWYATEIRSNVTGEKIDLTYEVKNVRYNSNKNWTYTFPNFGETGGHFETANNSDLDVRLIETEWRNGFANLNYSVTEAFEQEAYLSRIVNNRGRVAKFHYNTVNASKPGALLCDSIQIFEKGFFEKGWKFNYETEGNTDLTFHCDEIEPSNSEGQGSIYATSKRYGVKVDESTSGKVDQFLYYFPLNLRIFCLTFNIPIPLTKSIDKDDDAIPNYFYNIELAEYESLAYIKDVLDIEYSSVMSQNIYKGEFIRNYLYSIDEIDKDYGLHEVVEFEYETGEGISGVNGMQDMPKRFGINQDIWGYYNGSSAEVLPFFSLPYSGGINDELGTVASNKHFSFSTIDNGSLDEREWQANLTYAQLGQLKGVNLETGAYIRYSYDLQEYPSSITGEYQNEAGVGYTPENVLGITEGGLRLASTTKGTAGIDAPIQTVTYTYENPTIVNYPIFLTQNRYDRYYEDLEQKVQTSWMPLNSWLMNGSGYVGYKKVTEEYSENGKVVHEFTNAQTSGIISVPTINKINHKYKNVGAPTGTGVSQEIISYDEQYAPLKVKDWRLGLEHKTTVIDQGGITKQLTDRNYQFSEMQQDLAFSYPSIQMYQDLHYGSYEERVLDNSIDAIVDAGIGCPRNLFATFVKYLFKKYTNLFIPEHPFRYINKRYIYGNNTFESEKVEVVKERQENYFSDGSNWSESYYYYNAPERKLTTTRTAFSNGQKTTAVYGYADNFTHFTLDNGVLATLNALNYEKPIYSETTNGTTQAGGSITDFREFTLNSEKVYLPKSIWKSLRGEYVLSSILEYGANDENLSHPNPTRQWNVKYEDYQQYNFNAYDKFPPIDYTWNGYLELEKQEVEGFKTKYSYWGNRFKLKSVQNADGLITNYKYDNRGRLIEEVSPGGLQTTKYTYEMNTPVITTEVSFAANSLGETPPTQEQSQSFDGWGNKLVLTRINDTKVLSQNKYDELFRPVETTVLGTGTTSYTYENSVIGQVKTVTDAVDNLTTYSYLAGTGGAGTYSGVEVVDPNEATSRSWSDAFGNAKVSISGEGGKTLMTYNDYNQITEIINPIKEVYSYVYNEKLGTLAEKTIPQKGTETFWYDKSMRLVGKRDGNNKYFFFERDNIYRTTKVGMLASSITESAVSSVLEEGAYSIPDDKVLNETTYADDKYSWVVKTEEGIFEGGSIAPEKKINEFVLDEFGRVEQSTQLFPDYAITENYTPLNAAGVVDNVKKTVGLTELLTYKYTFNDILQQTTTELGFSTGALTEIEELIYNNKDQVSQKKIAQGLQVVDYAYDDAGKLIRINEPFTHKCAEEVELCQVYWSSEMDPDFDLSVCNVLNKIYLGEEEGNVNGIEVSDVDAIEFAIQSFLELHGVRGTVEVTYQSYLGVEQYLQISIMGTDVDIDELELNFNNGLCNVSFEKKDCCSVIVTEDGEIDTSVTVEVDGQNQPYDLFFEEITYDGLNISLIEMMGGCNTGLIKNHYQYDDDHRVTNVHNQLFKPELHQGAYSSSYTYDPAGNIKTLTRNGWIPDIGEYGVIDDLEYTYDKGLNSDGIETSNSRLLQVKDVAGAQGQPYGFGKTSDISNYTSLNGDAAYDGNGNLLRDTGKKLSMKYNPLNLVSKVTHEEEGNFTIDYLASGQKIRQGERKYINEFEFNNNTLELVHIPNGKIAIENGQTKYQYQITDHLGNVVVVFQDTDGDGLIEESTDNTNEVLQRNHYYSFGLRVEDPIFANTGTPENKYLYNGKEHVDDLGLDWHDYGARYYDAQIGRFSGVDPLAEKNSHVASFCYVDNNPIIFIDPDGKDNIIYLLALQGSSKYVDANKVAARATQYFKNLGLKTEVRVVTDVNKFNANKIDATDGIVVFGKTRKQTADFINSNLEDVSSEAYRNGLYSYWITNKNLNPETSERNLGAGGNVIAVNASEIEKLADAWFEEDVNDVGGFIITHGAGHLAGFSDYNSGQFYQEGRYLMDGGNCIRENIIYAKNTKEQCPACMEDHTTDPSEILLEGMKKRFGNNEPSGN